MKLKKIALTGLAVFQILQAPLALVLAEESAEDEESVEIVDLEEIMVDDEEDEAEEEALDNDDDIEEVEEDANEEEETSGDSEKVQETLELAGDLLEGEARQEVLDGILAQEDKSSGFEAQVSGNFHLMNETKIFSADIQGQVDESNEDHPMSTLVVNYVIHDEEIAAGDPVEVKFYLDKDYLFIEREDEVQKLALNSEDVQVEDPQAYRSILRELTEEFVEVRETDDAYILYTDYEVVDLDALVDRLFDEEEVGQQYDEVVADLDQEGSSTDRDRFIQDARLRTEAMAELILSSLKEKTASYDKESYELIDQHLVFELDSEKLQALVGMIALVDPDEVSLYFEMDSKVTNRGETIDHSTFPNAEETEDFLITSKEEEEDEAEDLIDDDSDKDDEEFEDEKESEEEKSNEEESSSQEEEDGDEDEDEDEDEDDPAFEPSEDSEDV